MSSTSCVPGTSLPTSPTADGLQTLLWQTDPIEGFDSIRRLLSQGPSPSSHPLQDTPRRGKGMGQQNRLQKRAVMDQDVMAEIRAVRNAQSRRGRTQTQSLTHLVRYAPPPRPPRQHYDSHHTASSRSYRRNPTYGSGSGFRALDKIRYVHANYRFVVSPTGNYAAQAADSDEHLDWSDILQIIASAESQQTSCPICLSEPVAPRMAKCGHIFCLPCLIRFMHSSSSDDAPEKKQNRWRKCPICEDTVYISEVKPVRFYAGQESPLPRPGDDVILRLMGRNAKSTLALPREGSAEVLNSSADVPWHFCANVLDYARIMKGTGAYMEEQYDREVEEILKQENEDHLIFHEDREWTQRAVKAANAAKEKSKCLGEVELQVWRRAAGLSEQRRHSEADFYFYTSPPHLYLSPLDIRILKTQYGSFSDFPSTLLPKVEHISTGHVVDDAMRKRAKYLGHLPYGCLISFLECDWTDIVPAEILEPFAGEIERRRKRNSDKAAQEEHERLQAERIEAENIRDARRNFGAFVSDEEVTVRFGNSAVADDTHPVNFDDFLPLGATPPVGGTTPPNPRSGFGALADVSTSPSGPRTVWGTPAIQGLTPEMAPTRVARPADDGWLKDDDVLETLATADIALQMEQLSVEHAGPSSNGGHTPGGSTPGGGGKKKKKQKITLMTTGSRRLA